MHASSCPFCGVVTPVPHETQAGCIAALHEEIARVKRLLQQSQPGGTRPPAPPEAADDDLPEEDGE